MSNITVIKLGGAVATEPASLELVKDVWQHMSDNERLVLVHGAGTRIDAELKERGIPVVKVDGLRITTPETADVVLDVMDSVGKELTNVLRDHDVPAMHVSANERRLLAVPKTKGETVMDRIGTATEFDAPALLARIPPGRVMVITPVGWDDKGPLNVNADEGAVCVATNMNARRLLLVTDVPGVMDASGKVQHRIDAKDVQSILQSGAATGGMVPKLQNALQAIEGGVHEVIIGGLGALAGEHTGTRVEAVAQ